MAVLNFEISNNVKGFANDFNIDVLVIKVFNANAVSGDPNSGNFSFDGGNTWIPRTTGLGAGLGQVNLPSAAGRIPTPAVDTVLDVWFRDIDGERKLCDFTMYARDNCLLSLYGFELINGQLSFLTFVGVRTWDDVNIPSSQLPLCASIDGFTTIENQKCGFSNNGNSSSSFPPSFLIEIANLPVIPSYGYRLNDGSCESIFAENINNGGVFNELEASFTKSNVSAAGASDGTITVLVSSGSGNYSFLWNDAATSFNRTGLGPGIYSVTITDIESGQELLLSNIEITEPTPPEPDSNPTLEIPSMQSLQFSVQETIDNCNTFENLDNKLFCEQNHPFFNGQHYYQKINSCDNFNVQIRSNTNLITARLKRISDNVAVDSYVVEKIFDGLNQEEDFDVRFQDNLDGKTRMYFVGSATIPIPLDQGDVFALINTTNDINGTYEVNNVLTDPLTNQQYLVLNIGFNSVNPNESGLARFIDDILPFNIYEFNVDFSAQLIGKYYIEVLAETNSGIVTGISEPIDLQVSHQNIATLQWANVDNAYDIDYSNNIVHRIRVEATVFDRLPSSQDEGIRTIEGRYNLLSSKPRRRIRAAFYQLPPYLHEKIFIAFKNDTVRLNGMLVTSEEGLEEPIYSTRYGLANSAIIFETNWFSTYNKSDVGGLNANNDAFIIANEGFIKR